MYQKNGASRESETRVAQHVARAVFDNVSPAAVGIARHYIDTVALPDGGIGVIVLDHRGAPSGRFDGDTVVPLTLNDLIGHLRARYPKDRDGVMGHRVLAAHLGLRNGQLRALLREGRGPVPAPDRRRGVYYLISAADLSHWIESNQATIARYRALDTQVNTRRRRRRRNLGRT